MDISMPNPTDCNIIEENAVVSELPLAAAASTPPIFNEDKVQVSGRQARRYTQEVVYD